MANFSTRPSRSSFFDSSDDISALDDGFILEDGALNPSRSSSFDSSDELTYGNDLPSEVLDSLIGHVPEYNNEGMYSVQSTVNSSSTLSKFNTHTHQQNPLSDISLPPVSTHFIDVISKIPQLFNPFSLICLVFDEA